MIFNELDNLIGPTVNVINPLYKSVLRITDTIKTESNNSNVGVK